MDSEFASDCSTQRGDEPDPAWTLCVRGTFLDSVPPASITSRRSSDPGPQSERPSFFAIEEDYAKELHSKMSTVMEEFAGLSSTAFTLPGMSPTSARSRVSMGFSGSSELQEPEGLASPSDASLAHGFPSNGSIGHPALCRQPCREPTSCRASCSFCHQCSFGLSSRKIGLDKKNRDIWRRMGVPQKTEALLGIMRAKVAELGLGVEATRALEEWHTDLTTAPPHDCTTAVQEHSTVTSWEYKRLQRHLGTLYLRDLCFVAGPLEDGLRAASIQMLEKLRDLRAAA